MDTAVRYTLVLLLLFCVAQQTSISIKPHVTIPWENQTILTNIPNTLSYDQEKGWNIIKYSSTNNPSQPELWKLSLPYIEYDPHGIVINYTTHPKKQEVPATWINSEGTSLPLDIDGLFPKIAFPYILGISSDRMYVKIFKIQDHQLSLVKELFLKDVLTSQAASPDGRFLLLGTLSSNILVLDTLQWEKSQEVNITSVDISIPSSPNIDIYGVSIENNGTFILLVNTPYQVIVGSMQNKKFYSYKLQKELVSPKTHPIFFSKNILAFGNSISHAFYLDRESIKPIFSFISRPYPIFGMIVTKSGYIATLYHKHDHLFLLDIQKTDAHTLLQSVNINSDSIPLFYEEKDKTYLLYQKGMIIL